MPSDYLINKTLTPKIDTFSFGVVLLELATGILAYDQSRLKNKSIKEYVEYVIRTTPDIKFLADERAGEKNIDLALYFIKCGFWCSNKESNKRPEMKIAYKNIAEVVQKINNNEVINPEIFCNICFTS